MHKSLYLIFGLIVISCGGPKQVETEIYNINSSVKIDSKTEEKVKNYRNQLQDSMSYVLCKSEVSFVKNKPNGNLNNLIADIVLHQGIEFLDRDSISLSNSFSLLNYGGLRAPINKGEITVGACFEVMPFENEIVVVKITKEDIKLIEDYLKRTGGHPVSNLELRSNEGVFIHNSKLDKKQNYYVFTSDYLYNGGDNMTFFKGREMISTKYKIRTSLIDYFNGKETISDRPQKRLTFDE